MPKPRESFWARCVMTLLLWAAACPLAGQQIPLHIWLAPPPPFAEQAWRYVVNCAGLSPQPGHDVRHVTWVVANLNEISRQTLHISVISQWVPGDTIILDTAYVAPVPVAHELLHVLLQGPLTGDGHPLVPFAYPCHLMAWQYPRLPDGSHEPRPYHFAGGQIVPDST